MSTLSCSRAAESEADAAALRMLKAAQVDPRGMIAMFELLQAEEAKLPEIARYARTHPESRERAGTLRALAGEGGAFRPALTDEQWQALRRICG
jgi:predicted Zn-dependent protease